MRTFVALLGPPVAAGLLLAMSSPSIAADKEPLLRLDAVAMNPSGTPHANPQHLDVVIQRWSSDAERSRLIAALKDKGSDALLSALQAVKPEVGSIHRTGQLGWPIQYAREHTLPDGTRRIVIATDRPMAFGEMASGSLSSQYQFLVAEIRLPAKGLGEGKLAPAARVDYNENAETIEIENYTMEPVALTSIKVEGGSDARAEDGKTDKTDRNPASQTKREG